jgi:hypothetical protein
VVVLLKLRLLLQQLGLLGGIHEKDALENVAQVAGEVGLQLVGNAGHAHKQSVHQVVARAEFGARLVAVRDLGRLHCQSNLLVVLALRVELGRLAAVKITGLTFNFRLIDMFKFFLFSAVKLKLDCLLKVST